MNASLTLRLLPSLLTDCVLVGHGNRADVVFTPRQWFALCTHMMNGNPPTFFLMPYQDEDGRAKFAKAYKANADDRMQWAWDTITGKAKSPASIGFYPTNTQRQSRWAAMDFDTHDDDQMRAREYALKAFAILLRQPQFFVALTTSAGDPQRSGWHLFIFTVEFYPVEDWTRLLRQVADQIGAPVRSGVCEIFPDGSRGIGRGIRAPGTWNPKNGECGLILRETLSKLPLASLPASSHKESNALYVLGEPRGREELSSPSSEIFRGEHGEWIRESAITAPSTRHEKLANLVGITFFQASKEVARKNAELQHGEANPAPAASLREHLVEFDHLWAGMERQWKCKLSPTEREKFDNLMTDTERDAFRILRNWSHTASPDFKVHCRSLSNRLSMSLRGASKLRTRFCTLGILRQTARHVPHKLAARYEWTSSREAKRKQAALISVSPQWNGDPGDARDRSTIGEPR
jgi:hypothetical protein